VAQRDSCILRACGNLEVEIKDRHDNFINKLAAKIPKRYLCFNMSLSPSKKPGSCFFSTAFSFFLRMRSSNAVALLSVNISAAEGSAK